MVRFFKEHKRLLIILAPALIGSIYLLLCFANIQNSIWFDESFSAYLSRFSYSDILKLTAADVHPPLYYLLLKLWSSIFGTTDFAMRAMSALFGALAIVLVFLFIKYKYGAKRAFLPTLLLAISPNIIRYGQEMRMYTLVLAIVFAASYVLQIALNTKEKKWWILYSILLALGMYTHYFCAFAWIAHLIYLFCLFKKNLFKNKLLKYFFIAAALYLPWIPIMVIQGTTIQWAGFWIGPVGISSILNYLGESFLYRQIDEVSNWILIAFLAILGIASYLIIKYRKQMSLLYFLALVPIICLIACSLPPLRPMFVPRYILYAICTLPILIGLGLEFLFEEMQKKIKTLRKKKARKLAHEKSLLLALLLIGIIIVNSGLGLQSVFAKGNFNFETHVQPVIKDVVLEQRDLDNGRHLPLISADVWQYYDLSFYENDKDKVYFLDSSTDYHYGSLAALKMSDFAEGGKIKDLNAFIENHPEYWYFEQLEDPSKKLSLPFDYCYIKDNFVSAKDDLSGNKFRISLVDCTNNKK